MSAVAIRPARPGDGEAILRLVRALAEYERLAHAFEADAESFRDALFGERPRVFCDLAEADGGPVGIAIWYYTFSTFAGRHGIFLEDLFVVPEARRLGIGRALLAGLARRCVAERLAGLEWAVLDWNEPAIGFYRRLGARLLDEWTQCRMTGEALRRLAGEPA